MKTITKILNRLTSRTSRFNPDQYWETRHQNLVGSLRAVGSIELTDDQNAEQYALKTNHILETLARIVPDPTQCRLLDAGCGSGQLTAAFTDAGYQTTAVDFSSTAITQARKRAPDAHFHVSPLTTLNLPGKRFDIIITIDVLMHLISEDDWSTSLASVANHLAPDGHWLIMDYLPNCSEPNPAHFNPRPLTQYQSLLKSLDLKINSRTQLHLPAENVTKDVLVVNHVTPAGP